MKITVIIPFFQRRAGLLEQALRSVAAQESVPPPEVIVIDDSSPAPPDADIARQSESLRRRITLLRQPNGGPGLARNAGLAAVSATSTAVAFLDSDDQWLPDHLARASGALEAGFDFYFSNYLDIGETEGGFTRQGLVDPRAHREIAAIPGVYAYNGDIRDQIIGRSPIETSTVVLRRQAYAGLYFPTDFRDAFEDLLFWFQCASRSGRIAFSMQVECRYGEGVNIFRGARWGTDQFLGRIVASTRFKARLRQVAQLTPAQREVITTGLRRNRKAVISDLLHRVRHRRPIAWRQLAMHVSADPVMLAAFFPELAGQVIRKARDPAGG